MQVTDISLSKHQPDDNEISKKHNVTVSSFQTKQILVKKCSGYFLPGQTSYIMGTSGAGKTTLLNSLCGRIRMDGKHILSGNMLINDTLPLTRQNFANFGVYVMQDNVLFDFFSVWEAL